MAGNEYLGHLKQLWDIFFAIKMNAFRQHARKKVKSKRTKRTMESVCIILPRVFTGGKIRQNLGTNAGFISKNRIWRTFLSRPYKLRITNCHDLFKTESDVSSNTVNIGIKRLSTML